jgi:hypothetical protein
MNKKVQELQSKYSTFAAYLDRNTIARSFTVLALLFSICVLIYSNVLRMGVFLFDDYDYILNNPAIQQLDSLKNITDPRYIGYVSFFLNYLQGGLEPFNFHLFNVVVHSLNAFLVFLLASLFIRTMDLQDGTLPRWWRFMLPLMVALLFLCHPLATQSVSYLTQRFTSLSTCFYLLTTVLYLVARTRFERLPYDPVAYVPYILSLLTAVLAMKTKEITFTIPFMLLILELILFGHSFFHWRRLVFLVPFILLLSIIPLSIYGPQWGVIQPGVEGVSEITRLDKIYDLEYRSRYEYFITQSRVVITYLRLLLFPWPQRVVYDIVASRSFWSVAVIFSFISIAVLHGIAIISWVGAQCSDGRKSFERRLIALGILWFFLTISIESSLIPIKDLIFEHRTYLPGIGFLIVAAVYLLRFAEWFRPAVDIRIKSVVMAVLLVMVLGSGSGPMKSFFGRMR